MRGTKGPARVLEPSCNDPPCNKTGLSHLFFCFCCIFFLHFLQFFVIFVFICLLHLFLSSSQQDCPVAFVFVGLFVFCLFVGVIVWKLENGEDLSGFACRPVYLHSSRNAYAPPICNASVHKNQPVVLWRWIFLRLPFKCSINILVAGQNNYRQGGNSPNLDG